MTFKELIKSSSFSYKKTLNIIKPSLCTNNIILDLSIIIFIPNLLNCISITLLINSLILSINNISIIIDHLVLSINIR